MTEYAQPLNQYPDDGEIYATMDQKRIPAFEAERGRQQLLCYYYEKACKSFSKAIMAFEYLLKDCRLTPEEIKAMLKYTIIPCYSNLTLSYYKRNMWESVVTFASQVLNNDKDNVKAYYRRGVAYKNLKRCEEARADLKKVVAMDGYMAPEVDKLLKEIKVIEEAQRIKRRKVAYTMLKGYTEEEEFLEEEPENIGFLKKLSRKITGCLKKILNKLLRRQTY